MQSQANKLINQIKLFLEGKLNYNVGLSLFMKICSDKLILIDLLGAESLEKKQILIDKLFEYYEQQKQLEECEYRGIQNSSKNNSNSSNTSESSENSVYWSTDYRYSSVSNIPSNDSIIIQLANERKKLYNLRGNIHSDLFNAVSDIRRHELAIKVMEIQSDIDSINAEIRKVESGLVPERFIKKSRSADEFVKIKNCQQYIRGFERKLKQQITLEQKEKYEKLLAKHKANLEKLING